jgi:putative membrane protein
MRAALGGVLMGLANLVPGISGGTMLLAAGIYPRFVGAIAQVSRLVLRPGPLALLTTVAIAAASAIVLLAGPVKELVVHQRWIMYSLFIGLTLGGLPVVWRMVGRGDRSVVIGAVAGFVAMAALAVSQMQGPAGGSVGAGAGMLVLAGMAGASAMILPGVSGGYLLLVLGQYVPILGAIDAVKEAVRAGDPGAAMHPATTVLLPVAIGVLLGIVAVSNLLQKLLAKYEKPTLGFLIGLLLGAVLGLWPFQAPVEPVPGETVIKGRMVTAETLPTIDADDWPTARFTPTTVQVAGSMGLVVLGFMITLGIARLGRDENG